MVISEEGFDRTKSVQLPDGFELDVQVTAKTFELNNKADRPIIFIVEICKADLADK
jgi:hypothetical protein